MNNAHPAGVVVDTMVISWLFDDRPNPLADGYRATLRADCQQIGHALGDKLHDGDRWIAAAAIRLDCPLVSHDGVFNGAPRLVLITDLNA